MKINFKKWLCLAMLTTVFFSLNNVSFAATQSTAANPDPYERFNRQMFGFNQMVDKALLKPAATAYRGSVPNFLRAMVSNFFINLHEIKTVANDLLQGQFKQARDDGTRLVINSTAGFLGVVDVASAMHLEHHDQDFGLTLTHWGVKQSPYLVLPFLGPSTFRDAVSIPVDYFTFSAYPYMDSPYWRNGLLAGHYIQTRAQLLEAERLMQHAALDLYLFQRDAYLQHRTYLATPDKE